jgi:methyltransferase-like protein/SAM-dependent methyltransferase
VVTTDKIRQAIPAQKVSYDEVLYQGHSYVHSHPNTMATVARLMGMAPAPVSTCRVLEIGCASGENLIPMAEHLPAAHFVGIDLSAPQIERGYGYLAAAGIENVELYQMDILEIGEPLGDFDYIIAHGIYSWVPPYIRERLLAVCQERLRPQGVAYVSYNTFPGWHLFQITRNMMLYRTRKIADPYERAKAARSFIEQMTELVKPENGDFSAFADIFRGFIFAYHGFLTRSALREDTHFLHDELEEFNDPIYFHEFVEQAAQHGLQYVGDAEFSTMMAFNLPKDAAQLLQTMAHDRIELEQYMDFFRNRSFRHTLLCRQEVELRSQIDMEALGHYFVASNAVIEDSHNLVDDSMVRFSDQNSASIATNHPVSKVAFDLLSRNWPAFYQIDELLPLAYLQMAALTEGEFRPETLTPAQRNVDRKVLATNLLKAYATSDALVRLFGERPPTTTTFARCPRASGWTRYQARQLDVVTNSFHYRVQLDPFTRFLLIRLDGTRTFEDLLCEVMDGPIADRLWSVEPTEDNPAASDSEIKRTIVAAGIKDRLEWILQSALLVS